MQREDAEAVVDALQGLVERRDGWDVGSFEVQRSWIEGDGVEYSVNVVYRQRGEAWTGFKRGSLALSKTDP